MTNKPMSDATLEAPIELEAAASRLTASQERLCQLCARVISRAPRLAHVVKYHSARKPAKRRRANIYRPRR